MSESKWAAEQRSGPDRLGAQRREHLLVQFLCHLIPGLCIEFPFRTKHHRETSPNTTTFSKSMLDSEGPTGEMGGGGGGGAEGAGPAVGPAGSRGGHCGVVSSLSLAAEGRVTLAGQLGGWLVSGCWAGTGGVMNGVLCATLHPTLAPALSFFSGAPGSLCRGESLLWGRRLPWSPRSKVPHLRVLS